MVWAFQIRQRVKPKGARIGDRREDDRWEGHVVARELYESTAGATEYVYVRWLTQTGEPRGETMRLEAWEVEAA